MLVSSTAHTFHYRWFVQLVRILSNQKSVLKLVTVLHKTHSQLLMLQMLSLGQTTIHTTDEYKSQTLCNHKKDLTVNLKGEFRTPLFLYLNSSDENYKNY